MTLFARAGPTARRAGPLFQQPALPRLDCQSDGAHAVGCLRLACPVAPQRALITAPRVSGDTQNAKVSPEVTKSPSVRAAMESIDLASWFRRVHEWFPGHSPLSLAPDYEVRTVRAVRAVRGGGGDLL